MKTSEDFFSRLIDDEDMAILAPKGSMLKAFDESEHPRGPDGKWIDAEDGGDNPFGPDYQRRKADIFIDDDMDEWDLWYYQKKMAWEDAGEPAGETPAELMFEALEAWTRGKSDQTMNYEPVPWHRIMRWADDPFKRGSVDDPEKADRFNDAIDYLISTAPIVDSEVYRGSRRVPDWITDGSVEAGQKIEWTSHTSASWGEQEARQFMFGHEGSEDEAVFYKIKNHRGALIGHASEYADENEIIIPRGSKFWVESIKKEEHPDGYRTIYVVELEGVEE